MVTRRSLLGTVTGAGMIALLPGTPARAQAPGTSANGWPIMPAAVVGHRINGSGASVSLREGPAAAVLLHVARRWHYEIGRVDTGEGGGVHGHVGNRTAEAPYETNYLSGTAIALFPGAFPLGGSESLYPYQELIVRDILLDCEGTVVWGGDLHPAKLSHFHVGARPGDRMLAEVAGRLDTSRPQRSRRQTAGAVDDPATPARRKRARRPHR